MSGPNPKAALCVGEDVVLATPAAARLLEGVSQGLLWERARRAVADGGERVCALALDGDEELLASCRAVGDEAAMVGVLVAIDPPRAARGIRRRAAAPRGLAGRSAAWRAAVAAVTQCAATRTPLLLWGEPGIGKAALVTAVARTAAVLDGALEAAVGPREWLARAQTTLTTGGTILVRHADALSPRTFDALAALPRAATAWVAATAAHPGLAERLGARAVELPPLRTRPEDVGPIAVALLRGRRLRPEAQQLLERLPWPGNVRELESALRTTHASEVRVQDLPAELRARAARVPTSGLQRLEAEAIARALAGCGGNKRDAARELGIARSTLYRKLRAYGLDLEHSAW